MWIAGRPDKERQRPQTPFEQFVNHNKRIDIQAMWRSLHDLFSLGVGYLEKPENHGNCAVLIIYLGYDRIPVVDTRIITKLRAVKTYGQYVQYPWVAKIIKGTDTAQLLLMLMQNSSFKGCGCISELYLCS